MVKLPLREPITKLEEINRPTDRRMFINKENGYIRRGMPVRAPGESEELIAKAIAKRVRRAAKLSKQILQPHEGKI